MNRKIVIIKEREKQSIIEEIRNLIIFICLGTVGVLYANYLPFPNGLDKIVTLIIIITLMFIYVSIFIIAMMIAVTWEFIERSYKK